MEIYLIRHTTVSVDTGVCYGHTDVPLAETFVDELNALHRKLPDCGEFITYASPSQRCRQLAERLCPATAQFDARLMEMNFGNWENQRWEAIGEETIRGWMQDFVHRPCPEGESFWELSQRVLAFWYDLLQDGPSYTLVITHGGVIRALLAHLLDFPLRHAFRIKIDVGSVTKVLLHFYGPEICYINR